MSSDNKHLRFKRDKLYDIKTKVKTCISNTTGLNGVIDILCYCQEEDALIVLPAVRGLHQIFSHFLQTKQIGIQHEAGDDSEVTKEEELSQWLQEQYDTACDTLLERLDHEEPKVQEAALVGLMKFVELQGQNLLEKPTAGHATFPFSLLQSVVERLLSCVDSKENLISRLGEVSEYDDLRFFLMKALRQQLRRISVEKRSEEFLWNVLRMLENIDIPDSPETQPLSNFMAAPGSQESQSKVSSLKEQKKLLTSCWMEFLRSELTFALYCRVLTRLDEKVLPFLSNPCALADFLTQAFSVGGAISVLALKGLFILMTKYNLNYPDFYKKLYSMFGPEVFNAKYMARFFGLADLFLSSEKLSSGLVASFMKRLSRISLHSSPAGARVALAFVANLMVRHKSCLPLVHNPDLTAIIDPFQDEETNTNNTQALHSSLWEIKTLQDHVCPEVAMDALKINRPIKQEQLLQDLLSLTGEQMFENATKKRKGLSAELSDEMPKSLLDFTQLFSID